jgi:hypothetical protein
MEKSKWFPNETLKDAVSYLLFYGVFPLVSNEGVIRYDDFLEHSKDPKSIINPTEVHFKEMFLEIIRESEKLHPDEHVLNLRMLAESSIPEVVDWSTEDLHSRGLLTSEEQMAEVNHFVDVEGPRMFAEIEEEFRKFNTD